MTPIFLESAGWECGGWGWDVGFSPNVSWHQVFRLPEGWASPHLIGYHSGDQIYPNTLYFVILWSWMDSQIELDKNIWDSQIKLDGNIFGIWATNMCEKHVQKFGQTYYDFLKTKKMRDVRTINLAVVSRRDLYYVSENESFCFGQNIWISRSRARLGLRGWGWDVGFSILTQVGAIWLRIVFRPLQTSKRVIKSKSIPRNHSRNSFRLRSVRNR